LLVIPDGAERRSGISKLLREIPGSMLRIAPE
jgi:hypothetical protein